MTTKEQERKALAQIRKIVAGLGEGSYIATAFEGCFEIAENNIENDFACSMKQRAESAERSAKALADELDEARKDYEAAHAAAHAIAEEKEAEITALKKRVLSPDDIEDFRAIVFNRCCDIELELNGAAAEIVKYAEAPAGDEFKKAVAEHRRLTKEAEYCKALSERIAIAQNNN